MYGLGDLSQILDERGLAAQARAVLESLREDLAKVVITDSYRKAVNALDEHGFVRCSLANQQQENNHRLNVGNGR